jgi:pyruvate/2-oxoglutarate dehydrogenase complex dihydrolipoamide acyltransferase (E2) component
MSEAYPVVSLRPLRRISQSTAVRDSGDRRSQARIVGAPAWEFRSAMVLRATLSADHRAIDGAVSAVFLVALGKRIAQPEHMRPQGAG